MKIAIWGLCLVLMLFWTGFAALTAGVTDWVIQAMASDQLKVLANQAIATAPMKELTDQAAQIPGSPWLIALIDPAWLQSLQASLTGLVGTVGTLTSSLNPGAWLKTFIWICWGVGMLVLLAGAGIGHFVVSRFTKRRLAA